MDIPSGEVIARNLSMPHSPRWHNDQLWVLESGNGGVGIVDELHRKIRFRKSADCRDSRGFDFAGPYAFVGLSQVRETAVFSGIAIAEKPPEERGCGVWIIDTRNGRIVGFVKFEDAVQEVFAVQVLRGVRWPEVLTEDPKRLAESYELPDQALQQVPAELRQPATGQTANPS